MATRHHALYRRLDQPPGDAARQSCYLTGSGGACVDTGADIFMEGTLVLSVGAIRELAEVAGYNVVDGVELEREVAEQARLIKQLEADKADLLEELDVAARLQARKQRAAK